ncbi:MAG: hypothetical protein OEW77_04265 [Gemmatimonadota bacterium]|nr:hypothetical protein [Gemmatimonadota bacterium]
MLLTSADLESIQRHCSHHRPLVERSTHAGCLRCGATFKPAEILEWIPAPGAEGRETPEDTAKCPKCGVDSVLPSAAPVSLDERTLAALRRYWFKDVH